ncbi:hypothetical protein Cni_G10703 [Canna indica]|uniref:Uncharacterized protein n=1 Tax=Canna indica TaxID=4628 RepID=A0AAQ3K6B6_9LILI|nr:hypothetical protein Cni_G10703 [Canna indica]
MKRTGRRRRNRTNETALQEWRNFNLRDGPPESCWNLRGMDLRLMNMGIPPPPPPPRIASCAQLLSVGNSIAVFPRLTTTPRRSHCRSWN